MIEKLIVTDIDGCLVNWAGGIPFFLHSKGMKTDHILQLATELGQGHWSVEKMFPASEDPMALMLEYNSSNFISHLRGFDDQYVVNRMVSLGYKFVGVTCMEDSPLSRDLRKRNLDAIYPGAFIDIYHVGVGQSKISAFQDSETRNGPALCYVDDLNKHLVEWMDSGVSGLPIHLDRNTRKNDRLVHHYNGVSYASDWCDIETILMRRIWRD